MVAVLHEAQLRALQQMTVGQRLQLNASLWEHARVLKEAAVRALHTEWSEEQVREAARKVLESAAR